MKKINLKTLCGLVATSLCMALSVQAQEAVNGQEQPNTDSVINVAFRPIPRKNVLGGVSVINVPELLKKNYAAYSLDNLQSFVGGYTGNGNLWGQGALILVDGVPRQAADVRLVEVESITVLKAASAIVQYGGTASKGVILITTKRGSIKPLSIDVRANTGFYVPKSYPKYLNAADYMTLYNEARRNDGNLEIYTAGAIDSTRKHLNPIKYPDIDFFSGDYLKNAYNRTDVTTEISGGNNLARYYTNIGVVKNGTIMNFGDQKNNNDFAFNVRGNVDMTLNKWLTASANAAINFADNYMGRGDFWGASNTLRPNAFSYLIPISSLDTANYPSNRNTVLGGRIIDGKYLLGGISTNTTNALADALIAGYIKRKSRTFLYNVGATADLGSITKGLSFNAAYSMDYRSLYSEAYQVSYATYQPRWKNVNGRDVIDSLTNTFGTNTNATQESIGQTTYSQTNSFRSQFNYNRTFAKDHNLTANLMGWWYTIQNSSDANNGVSGNTGGSDYQPIRNTNLGFQAGYNFREKYYVDFAGAVIHSAKLPKNNQNAISPSVTLGWRISEEKFFKNAMPFVDNLRLVGSYTSIKQDLDITGVKTVGANTIPTDYYLYASTYGNDGNLGGYYQWRDGLSGGFTTLSGRGSNPNLDFVQRKEIRAGLDASLFKHLITFDVNYFSQNTNGLLVRGGNSIYPSYFTGNGDFRPFLNYNNDKRSGVDFSANVNSQVGQVKFSLGVVGMFYSSKALKRDELNQNAYQNRAGTYLDASFGYISEGFFQNQAEINSRPSQAIFGTVRPGDIKYKDVNNDGVIDSKDQVNLGHNGFAAAPFNYGMNLTLNWKKLTLFVLGSGQTGAVAFKSGSYFWANSDSKYSEEVLNRWTVATQATATYPRLTTGAGTNNYQTSTFWMYKTNRFNLSRVQLTYDFDSKMFKKSFVHGLSVYILGDNLLVIAKERKLLELNIGSAPQYRFYNIGVKAAF